jgi:hypothetical protein
MYIFDTNVFLSLGFFYPRRFPTIWGRINDLADGCNLRSVREVRKELEGNCPSEYISEWVNQHRDLFLVPNEDEQIVVAEIFRKEQYRGLVRRSNMLKGLPVADPFVVAAGRVHNGIVVTQESMRPGGARIPTVCNEIGVQCINLERFLEAENLQY